MTFETFAEYMIWSFLTGGTFCGVICYACGYIAGKHDGKVRQEGES